MGRFKKLCAVVYLLSCVVALGTFAASLFGPATGRVEALLDKPTFRIVLAVCLVICALQALWVLLRVIIERPEPDCVRIDAAGEVQVALTAIESVARAAAREEDVLVEEVRGRITGRDSSGVRVAIDAIALTEAGLDDVAQRMRQRVEAALETMLGTPAASVRVRFLPSKTTTVTREV